MKRLAIATALLLPLAAHAQSTPGFTNGQIPSTAQWDGYFASKADVNGGTLNNATVNNSTLTSPTISNPTISNPTISGGNVVNSIAGASGAVTAAQVAAALGGETVNLGAGFLVQFYSGTYTGGTRYAGDEFSGGAALFVNSVQGTYAANPTTYPGGPVINGCAVTFSGTTGGACFYGYTNQSNSSGETGPFVGVAQAGANGANVIGGTFIGESLANMTAGQTDGLAGAVTTLTQQSGSGMVANAIEALAFGNSTYPAHAALDIYNGNTTTSFAAFNSGIFFDYSTGHPLVSYSYMTDDAYPRTNYASGPSVPNGILWDQTSFTTSEYTGPSFEVGPTVASYNSRIEITGSAGGQPTIQAVGAGNSPATSASLNLAAQPGGNVNVSASGGGAFIVNSGSGGMDVGCSSNCDLIFGEGPGTATVEIEGPLTVTPMSGTPTSFACFASGGQIISNSTPCKPIVLPVVTVASLPACGSSNKGELYAVSDATSPTYNGTLTGGGSTFTEGICNGSVWTAH